MVGIFICLAKRSLGENTYPTTVYYKFMYIVIISSKNL
jgi:hypothetical protein